MIEDTEPKGKMKDSGVPWIGAIPKNWSIRKLKFTDEIIMGQSPISDDYLIEPQKGAVAFLQGNAEFGPIHPTPKYWCASSNKITQPKDILISVRAPIGAVNIADTEYGIGRGLAAIRSKNSDFKFIYYFLLSMNEVLNSFGTGSTFKAIAIDDLRNLPFAFPSIVEQKEIAIYLDRKTTQLDALINNKQDLIVLLEQKRQSTINDAVTYGLKKGIKRKNTGISWLPEVPEHWEVKKLKFVTDLINEQDKIKGDYFIANENIESFTGKLIQSEVKQEFDGEHNSFKKDDVLFNKLRPYLSKVYLAEKDGEALGELLIFRVKNNVYPKFLFYRLISSDFISEVNSSTYGAKMPRASIEFIVNIKITFPNKKEQIEIANFIDTYSKRINLLKEKINSQILLLKRFRQSLISEVITGKVEVGTKLTFQVRKKIAG